MTKRTSMKAVVAALLTLQGALASAQSTWFVSASGNDKNPGTKEKPFATIQKARDVLRKTPHADKPVTVYLRGGVYYLPKSVEFTAEDGGTATAPVTYSAFGDEKVIIKGALNIPKVAVKKITQPQVLQRFAARLRDSIVEIDLKALGCSSIKPYADIFTDDGGIVELFVNQKRMPLSRYPNTGDMTMKKVLINGGGQESKKANWEDFYGEKKMETLPPRPGVFEYRDPRTASWAQLLNKGVWLKGFWRIPWQNEAVRVAKIDTVAKTITLAVPVPGGIGNKYTRPEGNGKEPYWLMNLPEEIDVPGEWALDFETGKLYFYPPHLLTNATISIADNRQPLILLNNAKHIQLKKLTVEENLGDGIAVRGGANNLIAGCTVRNVTQNGIVLDGGFDHKALSNDVYETGAGGIWLRGGDETANPRIPANFSIINNHVHHFSRLVRVYAAGINAGFTGGGGGGHHVAVGMKIEHNLVHHTPHVGVLFGSWDSYFAYNEVFSYCQVSDDMGAFYAYDKYERMGNHTFCYNFVHNSPIGDAIYFDHDHRDMKVFGNIIALQSQPKRRGTAYLYKIGSQVTNPQTIECYNNIAINCNYGFQFISANPVNKIYNNVSVNCGKPYTCKIVRNKAYDTTMAIANGQNMTYEEDPGFVNMAGNNFKLKPNGKIFKDLPGFKDIPIEKIGLFVDEYRKKLPTDKEIQRYEDVPIAQDKGSDILDRK